MSERKLAILELPDGKVRQTCIRCSEILEKEGMVTVVAELDGIALFKIKPPFTLDECKASVKGRHGAKH